MVGTGNESLINRGPDGDFRALKLKAHPASPRGRAFRIWGWMNGCTASADIEHLSLSELQYQHIGFRATALVVCVIQVNSGARTLR